MCNRSSLSLLLLRTLFPQWNDRDSNYKQSIWIMALVFHRLVSFWFHCWIRCYCRYGSAWRSHHHTSNCKNSDRVLMVFTLYPNNPVNEGMVHAWVAHFVTPLKYTYNKYDWRVTSQKPHKKHKSPNPNNTNKHDHHGGEAARPSSGANLMNPRCLRGGRHCACLFQCHRQSDLIDSIN
jgi:hypothetical protein